MNKEEFIKYSRELGINIKNNQVEQLEKYYELLIDWNERINLTSIIKKEDVYLKHFYDSITLIKTIDLNNNVSICDIGTGAGFPGLVLKIVFPNLRVTLVDSLNKRIVFLKEVIKILELENIVVINSRGEDFAKKNKEAYDIVTCRAVAKLCIISEICIPLVKVGGYFLPMKANIDIELENINYLKQLGSTLEGIETFLLPIENSNRNILKIKKTNTTSELYPRTFDQIKKRPLQ